MYTVTIALGQIHPKPAAPSLHIQQLKLNSMRFAKLKGYCV